MDSHYLVEILDNLVFSWLFLSLGMWKISEKMHWEKKWMAWVPGLRYYGLADSLNMRMEGIGCCILEILYYLVRLMPAAFTDDRMVLAAALGMLILIVALYAYRIRIFIRLSILFGLRRRWIVLWLLSEWVTLLILGFFKKYQPIKGMTFDIDWEAGMKPANISGAGDAMNAATASKSGLSVLLRERTVKNLGKKQYLLKDIALNIPKGSMVLLLGGSGAGKTTLVNAVIGYEKADADVFLNGEDVYRQYNKMKYRIGFVSQKNLIRANDTVLRTITDAAKLRVPLQIKIKTRNRRVKDVMNTLGLLPVRTGLVSKMSGGQLRRISIANELVSNPDLFVLDEPDSGLDGVISRELFTRLREIADSGKIVIAITHTPDRVIDMFDKVIILAKDSGRVGRLAFYGSPDEAKEFFGKDTMEGIIQSINRKEEGGDGLADYYIEKFAQKRIEKINGGTAASAEEAESTAAEESPEKTGEDGAGGDSTGESVQQKQEEKGVSPDEG